MFGDYAASAAAAKPRQSCPTLCNPIDGSPPGSPVPGILKARTLEWIAISFSNAWKWKVQGKSLSRVRLLATPWTAAYQDPLSMGFSRQEHWSGVPLPSPLVTIERPYCWFLTFSSSSWWLFADKKFVDRYECYEKLTSSVQSFVSDSLWPHEPQHARPLCPSPTPRVYPNPCPLSQWCHPTISSSIIPFFSCPQSFPASGSFPMSLLFTSGGQSIGVSTSTSVFPMNTQDWSPLGWTDWISLQSKGLSRIFSNTTVQKHQFYGVQLSL